MHCSGHVWILSWCDLWSTQCNPVQRYSVPNMVQWSNTWQNNTQFLYAHVGKLSLSTKAWSNTGLLLETLYKTELASSASMPRWHDQLNVWQIWASCRYYALNVNCKSYLYIRHSTVVLCSGDTCPCLRRLGLLLSFPSGCPRWLPFCRGAGFGVFAFGGTYSCSGRAWELG